MSNELIRLRQFIIDHYSLDELKTLCFDLGVNYDDLGGEGISAKVRELLLRLGKERSFRQLLDVLYTTRPESFTQVGLSSDPLFVDQLYAQLRSISTGRPGSPGEPIPPGRARTFALVLVLLGASAFLLWLVFKDDNVHGVSTLPETANGTSVAAQSSVIPTASQPVMTSTTTAPGIPGPEIPPAVLAPPGDRSLIRAANVSDLEELYRFGKGSINQVRWSPGGALLALGGSLGLYIHDANTLELNLVIETPFSISTISFSPDSSIIAAAGSDSNIWLLRAGTGESVNTLFGHTDQVYDLSFSPNGQMLASASGDGTVRLWDVSDQRGRTLAIMPGGRDETVTAVAFSPDGMSLFTGSTQSGGFFGLPRGFLRMWDALNGELLYELGEPTEVVSSVAFSPKESIVAASLSQIPPSSVPGNSSTRVQLWDLSSQQPISPALGTTAYKISFSPEGDSLLTSGYSGAELWDIATGQMLRRFSATEDRMIDAAFSPMGNMVATVGTDGNVIIWNTATAEELKRVEYTPALTSLAFSPTGNAVAFGGEDHLVQIWDIENGTRLRWLSGHQAPVTEIAFSQDGRYIVTGDEHDAPRLWTSEGAFLRSLGEELQDIDDIVFGPGSKIVAATEKTYSEGNVQVWDTETGALLQQLTYSSTLTALAFHPLNQLIATASQDRLVRIWDLGSGEISRTLAGHFQTVTAALAFSPDGSTLASGAYGEILLWNMNTFVSRSIHEEGLQYIPGITFSHDGELLASPANDNDIHIWSVKTGQLLRTLEGHQGNVLALAFSPDGRWLAASATDGTARIWGISSN